MEPWLCSAAAVTVELLSQRLQVALAQLCVFAACFDVPAASDVMGTSRDEALEIVQVGHTHTPHACYSRGCTRALTFDNGL